MHACAQKSIAKSVFLAFNILVYLIITVIIVSECPWQVSALYPLGEKKNSKLIYFFLRVVNNNW